MSNVTINIRLSLLLLGIVYCYPDGKEYLDGILRDIWRWLYAWPPSHWNMAEAMVATLGFWVAGGFFEMLHVLFPQVLQQRISLPDSKADTNKKPKIITSLSYFLSTKIGGSLVYLMSIAMFHAFLRPKSPLPIEAPTFGRFVIELCSGIIGYDLFFTPVHWSLHAHEMVNSKTKPNLQSNHETTPKKPTHHSSSLSFCEISALITNPIAGIVTQRKFGYMVGKLFGLNGVFSFARRLAKHGVHHEMRSPLQAGSTVHHSLIDGGAQVFVNILVQNNTHLALLALPCRLLSRHLGYELDCFQWLPMVWLLSLPLLSLLQEQSNNKLISSKLSIYHSKRHHHQQLNVLNLYAYWAIFITLGYFGYNGDLSFALQSRHPLSRAAHNLLVTWLLCEAHSGYDLPWMTHRVVPGVFGGAPAHSEHHQYGDVNFQQFFTYLDNSHGFASSVTLIQS